MELTRRGICEERQRFLDAGYALPEFDIETVTAKTKAEPVWLHFGTGNIFRAFQANVVQQLLNEGVMDRGIVAAGGSSPEIVERVYRPHDNLGVLVTLKADGRTEKTVVGSIVESLVTGSAYAEDYARMQEIFRAPSLQLISFTITEKGYRLKDGDGKYLPAVAQDMANGPGHPVSYLGIVTAMLYERYKNGALPLACVSMDNCSHNGDVLRESILEIAEAWVRAEGADARMCVKKNAEVADAQAHAEKNAKYADAQTHAEKNAERVDAPACAKADAGFLAYLGDAARVSFPCTMIDKITPRPDARVEAMLSADGIAGLEQIATAKGTFAAPFVNAEECEYLVIEDQFPNGRPALEKGGILFADRATVERAERMKVCTCLNPLHTALAVYGCLLGYERISDEMKNPVLRRMAERIGYQEGLPVVTDPGILSPEQFLDEVLRLRLPNPFLPDTPQRIATDTSQKLSVRFGETVKCYLASDARTVGELRMIPLVFAGWLRYLMAVDDEGRAFSLSPDPMLGTLLPCVAGLKLGQTQDAEEKLRPILENAAVFGVNLYEAGLAEQVLAYFAELSEGRGAVARTLERYVQE